MNLIKGRHRINSLEDWFEKAPPKGGERHWQDGRSAKESAKAWLESGSPTVPTELKNLFDSSDYTRGFYPDEAEAEAQIRFDKRPGEQCNADLALIGFSYASGIGCTIEAKVNEHFGKLLPDVLCSSLERWCKSNRSRGLDRVKDLVQSVLPANSDELPLLRKIRYQLLTAVAGTLAWANSYGHRRAVLVIHGFRTLYSSSERIAANAADLDAFIRRLSKNEVQSIQEGEMLGPFQVPGRPLFDNPPDLFIGKAVRHMAISDNTNSSSGPVPPGSRHIMLD